MKIGEKELLMQYVFMDTIGNYIAIDNDSGGYPYTTENIFRAHIWKDRKEAFKYRSHFEDWELYEIKDVIMEKVIPIKVQEVHYE